MNKILGTAIALALVISMAFVISTYRNIGINDVEKPPIPPIPPLDSEETFINVDDVEKPYIPPIPPIPPATAKVTFSQTRDVQDPVIPPIPPIPPYTEIKALAL